MDVEALVVNKQESIVLVLLPLTLTLNTKSVNVLGMLEKVTDAADDESVLDAISE